MNYRTTQHTDYAEIIYFRVFCVFRGCIVGHRARSGDSVRPVRESSPGAQDLKNLVSA